MFDFTYTEEQEMLKTQVRDFAKKELGPVAWEYDKEEKWPSGIWTRLAELGLICPTIPMEYGGGGMGYVEEVIISEELAVVSPGIACCPAVSGILCADNLSHNANESQKKKYLPPLCSGEAVGCIAITEPKGGSDAVGSMETTAVKKDNYYILNGQKVFISNAWVGTTFIVYAKTAPEKGARGVSAFIVERDFPGFEIGKPYDKFGCRALLSCPLYFTDCKVSAENLMRNEGEGAHVMMSGLNGERVAVAALPIGAARGAFEDTLNYAKERVVFGKPIIKHQMIAEKFADMYTEIEAARLLMLKGAWQVDHFGLGREQTLICSAAKLYAVEMGVRVTYKCMDIYGGYGYIMDNVPLRFFRDAYVGVPGAGTQEIQRLIITGELEASYMSP